MRSAPARTNALGWQAIATPGGMTLGCCLNKGSEIELFKQYSPVTAPDCADKACLDEWRTKEEASIAHIPEAFRHFATDSIEAAYKKALAKLRSTSSDPAQLAAVGMPTVGAAFFVVFVVGVAIGARFGRSSTQKDEYHVMG